MSGAYGQYDPIELLRVRPSGPWTLREYRRGDVEFFKLERDGESVRVGWKEDMKATLEEELEKTRKPSAHGPWAAVRPVHCIEGGSISVVEETFKTKKQAELYASQNPDCAVFHHKIKFDYEPGQLLVSRDEDNPRLATLGRKLEARREAERTRDYLVCRFMDQDAKPTLGMPVFVHGDGYNYRGEPLYREARPVVQFTNYGENRDGIHVVVKLGRSTRGEGRLAEVVEWATEPSRAEEVTVRLQGRLDERRGRERAEAQVLATAGFREASLFTDRREEPVYMRLYHGAQQLVWRAEQWLNGPTVEPAPQATRPAQDEVRRQDEPARGEERKRPEVEPERARPRHHGRPPSGRSHTVGVWYGARPVRRGERCSIAYGAERGTPVTERAVVPEGGKISPEADVESPRYVVLKASRDARGNPVWRALGSTRDLKHALARSGELCERAARERAERGEHAGAAARRVERSNEHKHERGFEQGR